MWRNDEEYWIEIERRAKELGTDGCSGLLQWFKRYCYEHDIHYRTHRTLDGNPIGKWKSDAILAWRHLNDSPAAAGTGILRWVGLTVGGWWSWYDTETGSPLTKECNDGQGP